MSARSSPSPSFAHLVEDVGVAGEVDPPRAGEHEPERVTAREERRPGAVVIGERRRDAHAPDLELIPDGHLGDVREAPVAQDLPDPPRDDDAGGAAEREERGDVEVVVVGVRDEHGVDVAHVVATEGGAATQVRDAPPQERVGQETRPVECDEHGRVPDVRHACHAIHSDTRDAGARAEQPMLSPATTGGRMGERREVEPLVATAEDARPLWFGSGLSTIRLDAGQTAGRLTVHEHVLPGGFQSPLHAHVEDDEVFYVLEGRLTAHLDGVDERASTGDVILFPRAVPHAFRVESPRRASSPSTRRPGTSDSSGRSRSRRPSGRCHPRRGSGPTRRGSRPRPRRPACASSARRHGAREPLRAIRTASRRVRPSR